MMKNKKMIILIIPIATVIIFALSLFISKSHRTPHVTMKGSYDIINEHDLHNFKSGTNFIDKIKVSTSDKFNYILTRRESIIHVEIFNASDEFLRETTCGKLDYYYEPYSYASERVQLQNCSPGQEIYELGPIAL